MFILANFGVLILAILVCFLLPLVLLFPYGFIAFMSRVFWLKSIGDLLVGLV